MPKGHMAVETSLMGSGLAFPIHGAFFPRFVRGVFGDTMREERSS
jgi:hypothetical protein